MFEPVRNVEHIISMLNKQASGGHPYYKKKGLLLDIVKKVMKDISSECVDAEIFTRPAVIHRALQPGDNDIKNRWIFCVPIEITVIEMYFGIHIVSYFLQNDETPLKLGSTQLELHRYLMKKKVGKSAASGDYSKFDSTLPKHLQYTSFHIIKHMLNLSDYESTLFDVLVSYIVNCNAYHPHTGYVIRNRGLISGSFYTNLVDSITNAYVIEYCYHLDATLDSVSNSLDYSVSGDDSVFFYDKLNLGLLSKRVKYYFDMVLNFPDEHQFGPSVLRVKFLGSVFGQRGPFRGVKKMAIGAAMTSHK
jgi:hypothetical protein